MLLYKLWAHKVTPVYNCFHLLYLDEFDRHALARLLVLR